MMASSLRTPKVHDVLRDAEPGNGSELPTSGTPADATAMIEHLKDEFGDYSTDPQTSNWFWRGRD